MTYRSLVESFRFPPWPNICTKNLPRFGAWKNFPRSKIFAESRDCLPSTEAYNRMTNYRRLKNRHCPRRWISMTKLRLFRRLYSPSSRWINDDNNKDRLLVTGRRGCDEDGTEGGAAAADEDEDEDEDKKCRRSERVPGVKWMGAVETMLARREEIRKRKRLERGCGGE